LYIVAGEVVARISGLSWEDFIQKRILDPLGMKETAPSFKLLQNKSNIIDPHASVNGAVKVIRRDWNEIANAAGGIYSNLTDMCKWVLMLLNDGKYGQGSGKRLFTKEVHEEMWTPQTIIPVRGQTPYNTHFASYGLGWFLRDEKGYKVATHTGGLAGIVTQVTLIPELKLGIIVFTNQQVGAAFSAITNSIKDGYYGIKENNWVKIYSGRVSQSVAEAKTITDKIWKEIEAQQKISSPPDAGNFIGTYNDKWFGDVVISQKNGRLWFDSKRSFLLSGEMFYYKGNTFIVKWNDHSMDADAYVMFSLDNNGKASAIKMNPISPLTDFSFDFQDLDLIRVK
jgi:hypothetical protein